MFLLRGIVMNDPAGTFSRKEVISVLVSVKYRNSVEAQQAPTATPALRKFSVGNLAARVLGISKDRKFEIALEGVNTGALDNAGF